MSATACVRCHKELPPEILGELERGTRCPFCSAALRRVRRNTAPLGRQTLERAGVMVAGPPAPPAKASADSGPNRASRSQASGEDAFGWFQGGGSSPAAEEPAPDGSPTEWLASLLSGPTTVTAAPSAPSPPQASPPQAPRPQAPRPEASPPQASRQQAAPPQVSRPQPSPPPQAAPPASPRPRARPTPAPVPAAQVEAPRPSPPREHAPAPVRPTAPLRTGAPPAEARPAPSPVAVTPPPLGPSQPLPATAPPPPARVLAATAIVPTAEHRESPPERPARAQTLVLRPSSQRRFITAVVAVSLGIGLAAAFGLRWVGKTVPRARATPPVVAQSEALVTAAVARAAIPEVEAAIERPAPPVSARPAPEAAAPAPAVHEARGHEARGDKAQRDDAREAEAPSPPAPRVARSEDHDRARRHGTGSKRRKLAQREVAPKRHAAAPTPAPETSDPREAYERGNSLLFAGDAPGATAAYREAVRLAPSDPIGYRGLGLAYEQQGDTAAAVKALRRYLKLAPKARDHELIARRIQLLARTAAHK